MRNTGSIVLAIAVLGAAPALAADMAVKAPLPARSSGWTGWYVGLNAGWIGADDPANADATILSATTFPATATALATALTNRLGSRPNGFIGGVQAGYNYQLSPMFVAGLEADIQGANVRGSANASRSADIVGAVLPTTWNAATTVSHRLDYLGTARGRIGIAATPALLLYGTGGLAFGGVSASTSTAITARSFGGPLFGVPDAVTAGSMSQTRYGWTAGAGGEWMFAPGWSAKLEYLHYDLGSATYATGGYNLDVGATFLPGTGLLAVGAATTQTFKGDIVRAGVNYRFGG